MKFRIWPAAFLAAWFLAQTWRGLFVEFTQDDLMNAYWAWQLPWTKLLLANLTPFTSVYRPFGSLFYRALYSAAGLHPMPFRIFDYAILLLNIFLLWRVVERITGSRFTGVFAALLFSYHKRLFAMLVNGGTVYDLLSLAFFLLAFDFYLRSRESGHVTGWRMLGFCALYTLALNSKEMAASLPAILLVYELVYHRKSFRFWDRRALWIAAAMTIAAFSIKPSRGSSFFGVPDYQLHFTAAQYFSTTTPLLSQLFFFPEKTFGGAAAIAVFLAAIALAALLRDRAMILGIAIAILAPLPVNFIAYRGFFVMYLPLAGWALYFASLTTRLVPARPSPRIAAFLATALALFVIQFRDATWRFDYPRPEQEQIHRLRRDLVFLRAPHPHRVLFLHQAVDSDSYIPLYVVRLLYRDPQIAVDAGSHRPNPLRPETYDLLIDLCRGHYVRAGSCR